MKVFMQVFLKRNVKKNTNNTEISNRLIPALDAFQNTNSKQKYGKFKISLFSKHSNHIRSPPTSDVSAHTISL